jgi:hypothetical protein
VLASAPAAHDGGAGGAACQIQASQEHAPGWPFDLPTFRDQVLPILLGTCVSCHAGPTGMGGFVVAPDAAPGNCGYAQTFNSFTSKIDLTNPQNSAVWVAISGGDPKHPFTLPPSDPRAMTLLGFIQNAAQKAAAGTPPPAANPFDYQVFKTAIEPIIETADGKGCTNASCHGAPAGLGGFHVVVANGDEPTLMANFQAVTSHCDIGNPAGSLFYIQATNRHDGGLSALVTADQGRTILDWISAAKANTDPASPTPTGCIPPDALDLAVFAAEIQPILLGQVDLNNPQDPRTTTGCARPVCHGADRTGGALVLKATNTAAVNLTNFGCFVNLASPIESDILRCPLNDPGCRHAPHPGGEVFSGPQDLNYQRVLSYLYAAKTAATPLDFAFYARRVNPIFDDPASVQGGAQGRSCSDVVSCHGTVAPGQRPPNGSNFPILAQVSDRDRLLVNFSLAENFIDVVQAEGSSLYLYPTDEIANLANPLATGLHHPGGLDFAPDSVQAAAILKWAHGLRPDGQGFVHDFLVAGDFSAFQITDSTGVDEPNARPSIFDAAPGAGLAGGIWDGLFADSAEVDLGAAFPRAGGGRAVYAAVYLFNISGADVTAQVTVSSPNAIRLYAGTAPLLQADGAAAGTTGLVAVPAYTPGSGATRLLLKVLQHAGDANFGFSLQLQDELGNPLTDSSGQFVLKLGPDGGI